MNFAVLMNGLQLFARMRPAALISSFSLIASRMSCFDLPADGLELNNIIDQEPDLSETLNRELNLLEEKDYENNEVHFSAEDFDLESDGQLIQRLKGLGIPRLI